MANPGGRPTGHSTDQLRRVINPARALADRLDAAGAARDANIIRRLLKSHSGQRSWIQVFHANSTRVGKK